MNILLRVRSTACTLPIFALFLAACGEPPPAATPPQAAVPSVAPVPSAAPAPSATPAPSVTAAVAPVPSAAASAEPAKPAPRQSSGRPAVIKTDSAEINDTFGISPGSKLELGAKDIATLRLPEGALPRPTNLTFKIDPRGKSTIAQVGMVYHLRVNFPPSGAAESVESTGEPFLLEMPAGSKKNANLAIGVEDKGTVQWTILAPKRIDDVRNVAIFELTTLPSAYLHVTTKPVPAAKK